MSVTGPAVNSRLTPLLRRLIALIISYSLVKLLAKVVNAHLNDAVMSAVSDILQYYIVELNTFLLHYFYFKIGIHFLKSDSRCIPHTAG